MEGRLFPATLQTGPARSLTLERHRLGPDTAEASVLLYSSSDIHYFFNSHLFESYKFQMSPGFVEAGACSSISHFPYCFWVISKRRSDFTLLSLNCK